jgi:hypothetical protein
MAEHHKSKRIWEKPELVILVRGRPEELVPTACKGTVKPAGAGNANNACHTTCGTKCNALAGSWASILWTFNVRPQRILFCLSEDWKAKKIPDSEEIKNGNFR